MMRPVNRGPAPPNSIRQDTMLNLRADASQGPLWNFNAAPVIRGLGGNALSRWQLLQAEQSVATKREPPGWQGPPWNLPNLKAASATISRRLATDQYGYQAAGPPLGARLGKFCSYCEQFLPGQIAVEHCAPKSQFPYFTLCWENFLLACDACNGPSGKGQKPSRRTVNGWGGQYNDDCTRNAAIRVRYVWPDINARAYRDLLPVLTAFNNQTGKWVALPNNSLAVPGMRITGLDLPNRVITATIYLQGNPVPNVKVAAWLESSGQATESIPYFGFERDGTGTGKIADCRMYNRTIAWFKAVTFLAPIAQNINNAQTVWPLVALIAPSVGFFSVWVRVLNLMGFDQVNVPGSNPQVTFMQSFLQRMAFPDCFPNTNTVFVP
jgi:hypothetical protein